MKKAIVVVLVFAAALTLATYLRARGDVRSSRHAYLDAEVLRDSLEPLIEAFNSRRESPRLLVILSPICPVCFAGSEAIRSEILQPGLEIEILLVWMEAVPYDIVRNPARRIVLFSDEPRVQQFYDAGHLAGDTLARKLGWPEDRPAWDVYLFFEPGQTWQDDLPEPYTWFHQHESAPGSYRTGEELEESLRSTAMQLVSAGLGG